MMNRRMKERMDERRRKPNDAKQNNHNLNSSTLSKNLMDNYFQSQKIIQSLSASTAAVNEVKPIKPFKIPKKQPVTTQAGRYKGGIDGSNPNVGPRSQYNHRLIDSRRNPIGGGGGGGRADDFNIPRRDFNNVRGNQKRRFKDDRRKGYPVRPERDSYNGRNKPDRFEPNERPPPRRSQQEERRKREDVFAKKAANEDNVDPVRPRKEAHRSEDTRGKPINDSKRARSESPLKERILQRKAELEAQNKAFMKNRYYFNEPIDIIITDRSAANGKISPENAAIFLNEIEQFVAKRILTEPKYQTKFIGHSHQDGLITMTCADDFTSVFLQQKLTEELPLWPGAKLEWSFGHFKSCFITLVVPKPIGHLSEFLDICKKTDGRMLTEKWRRIDCENTDDESGKLYKLGIDRQSYGIIKQQGCIIRCGEENIKIELDPNVEVEVEKEPNVEIEVEKEPNVEVEVEGKPNVEVEVKEKPNVEVEKPWKQKRVKLCLKRISLS